MTIVQSAAEFSNVVPRGIWFPESPNKYVYEFFICNYKYIWQPKSALAGNESASDGDSFKKVGATTTSAANVDTIWVLRPNSNMWVFPQRVCQASMASPNIHHACWQRASQPRTVNNQMAVSNVRSISSLPINPVCQQETMVPHQVHQCHQCHATRGHGSAGNAACQLDACRLHRSTSNIIIIIIDNRGLNARWCLTPLLLSLPTVA